MSESSDEILKRMDEPYNSVGRWAIQCALDCRNAEREVERLRAIIDRCGICRDLLDGKRTVVQKQWDDVQEEVKQLRDLAGKWAEERPWLHVLVRKHGTEAELRRVVELLDASEEAAETDGGEKA